MKIVSNEPVKKGRWVCMDYFDQTTKDSQQQGQAEGNPTPQLNDQVQQQQAQQTQPIQQNQQIHQQQQHQSLPHGAHAAINTQQGIVNLGNSTDFECLNSTD